jgi:hypothetical protein
VYQLRRFEEETRSPGRVGVRAGATLARGSGTGSFLGGVGAGVEFLRGSGGGAVTVRAAGVVADRVGCIRVGARCSVVWRLAPLVTTGNGKLRIASVVRLAVRDGSAVSGAEDFGFSFRPFSSAPGCRV